MQLHDVINFGKGLVEGYLEKALELARSAETQYRKAVETWNFLAEMLPFPVPRLGGVEDPYEPYEPPPAPDFANAAGPTAAATKAAAGPGVAAAPPLQVVERPAAAKTAPATPKPIEARAEAPKPAEKKAEAPKPAEKKAEAPKPVEKKAEAPKSVEKKAEAPKPAEKKASQEPAKKKTAEKAGADTAAPPSRSALAKMKKADLQKLARAQGVSYTQSDTVAVLVERILEKTGRG